MRLSVILSTYNAPAWLEKAIWGYATQTHRDFELVIADDGSTEETARLLRDLAAATGLAIRHVWHEDLGFRKCRILNRAIEQASSDYLVFSDGDCIPRQDFLETHHRFAKPGRFLSGGLVRLPMDISQRLTAEDIREQHATQLSWLLRQGLRPGKKSLRLATGGAVGVVLDKLTPTKPTWNGHNASGWKADLLCVNGFDERMGYGGEDCELGERLVNIGIRPFQIRHRAICVHLDHARGYVDDAVLQWNRAHREHVRRDREVWTDYGIRFTAQPDTESTVLKFPTKQQYQREQRKAA